MLAGEQPGSYVVDELNAVALRLDAPVVDPIPIDPKPVPGIEPAPVAVVDPAID